MDGHNKSEARDSGRCDADGMKEEGGNGREEVELSRVKSQARVE